MKETTYLINTISQILYKKDVIDTPHDMEWMKVEQLIVKNGFTALVFDFIKRVKDVPSEIIEHLAIRYEDDLRKVVMQEYYAEQILGRFEKENIRCLPLKGIILRNLYPKPYMRSMTDLDILVDTKKLQKTREIMSELGFEIYQYDEHHDIYNIRPYVNVELHKLLIVGEMEDYFQIGFERAHLKEGCSYTYEMSLEDFYIHILGHMAYHFAHGGVGIRLVLDIRVYLDKYGEVLNREYINEELDKVGLCTFAHHIEKLSEIWFLDAESNEFYDELGNYIVQSGYLGTRKHKEILEVVKKTGDSITNTSKCKAIIEAIFPSFKTMAFLYPVLKRVPILYPFTWVARWIDVIVTRRENIARIQRLSQTEDADIKKFSKLYDDLKVKHLL